MPPRGRPRKLCPNKAFPTPFTHQRPVAPDEHTPEGSVACMFPGCRRKLLPSASESGLALHVAIPCDSSNSVRVFDLTSCEEHAHIMKARGQKKGMDLQQHSHMRNVYSTLLHVVRRSCRGVMNELQQQSTTL